MNLIGYLTLAFVALLCIRICIHLLVKWGVIKDFIKNDELLEWIEMWRANCKYVEAWQRGLCEDCPVNKKCEQIYGEVTKVMKNRGT